MLAASVVAALAAAANAAQVNFFFTSTADPLAMDPGTALANSHNPVLPVGNGIPIDLWMAIPQGSPAITGMGFDLVGSSAGSAFPVDNSTGRWNFVNFNGAAGNVWSGFVASTLAPVGPGGAQPGAAPEGVYGTLLVYHMGSGTVNTVLGDAMYLQVSDFASVGNNSATGLALAAFGFADSSSTGNWDTFGRLVSDGTDVPGAGSANGFEADGINGPVNTRTPDLTVIPEPATLALMGLAGLLIRRRK